MRLLDPISTRPADRPLDIVRSWPADRPLVMLHSAATDARWSRRSIIAAPRTWLTVDANGPSWLAAPPADLPPLPRELDPLDALQHVVNATADRPGCWIGWLSYDLGRVIEPTAGAAARGRAAIDDRRWPLLQFAWCPDALLHDNTTNTWTTIGNGSSLLSACADRAPDDMPVHVGPLNPSVHESQYVFDVRAVIDAIAAGDVFQANYTQRLTAPFAGSARRFARAALSRSGAWFGAHLELPGGRAICSLSPELFLQLDGRSRQVTTRPIKGTRPAGARPDELRRSAKDTAELTMIIDLMRNDLGRVCAFGSVCVPHHRVIESHAGVHHGVGEVVGRLRDECSIADLLRATLPAGSITGAPKIRAMQIIDTLEATRRGPYCGAIGCIEPSTGDVSLNVAIRTVAISGTRPADHWDRFDDAVLDYGAGGGIVADSIPHDEYREMLDKTQVLRDVIRAVST